MLKKQDVILVGGVLVICLTAYLFLHVILPEEGSKVVIWVDGEKISEVSLKEDGEYTIDAGNGKKDVLKIENGQAKMLLADCPDHLCLHQPAIFHGGETIVCLPLKIVVEVVSDEEQKIDAIVQ